MTDQPFRYAMSETVVSLVIKKLMTPRSGFRGWLARKLNWSYGWMELEKSEADALLELDRELRIYE